MKEPARPSKPNYGNGYDQKNGDQYGERDGHGGYVPDNKNVKNVEGDKDAYNGGSPKTNSNER